MRNIKLNLSKEEKFKHSLKSWGSEVDNRPFIRVKENKARDEFEYNRKREKLIAEKKKIAAVTGDPIENIYIWDKDGFVG